MFTSMCEHHMLPFYGTAKVVYMGSGRVIGLSKLNRIVEYYAQRPQIQERMTKQILETFKTILETDDVLVEVEAQHSCIMIRGVKSQGSTTMTREASGMFKDHPVKL